ncbi:hypothetical protein [Rossellomorea vietnamensis]|uniref:hypothetical protein n=1 Tax=Rossellomorea vietnamensis TaxID=218284 RepID=UPI002078A053|nr:hypothetical protein [Rossellomorea vietnamensis]
MEELVKIFKLHNFDVIHETTKAIEFENIDTKELVYLMPNKEISLALNPETVESSILLKHMTKGFTHSTALKNFPKRKNTGETPIPYGYGYKFQSAEELSLFLREFNLLIAE